MPKVLLADDSATMQKVVDLVLRDQGYDVVSANTGEDALSMINSAPPDLVLAYIKLPGTNGYELCRQIKTNPATQGIPVILLAGAFDPVDEAVKAQVQANGSLIKPFQAEDLLSVINAHLGGAAPAAPAAAVAAVAAEDDIVFEGEDAAMSFAGVAENEPVAAQAVAEESFADLDEPAEAVAMEAESFAEYAEPVEAEAMEAESFAEYTEPVEAEAMEAESFAEYAEPVEAEAMEAESFAEYAEPAQPAAAQPVAAQSAAAQPASAQPASAQPASAMPAVDSARLEALFRQTVEAKVTEAIANVDIKSLVVNALEPHIKEVLEKIAYDTVPELLDRNLKSNISESLTAVNRELENIIWETVPELAEELLKKELTLIRQESQ